VKIGMAGSHQSRHIALQHGWASSRLPSLFINTWSLIVQKLIAVASFAVAVLAGFGSAFGGVRLARALPALPAHLSLALTTTYGPVEPILMHSARRQGVVGN
jgi:hypothetical protein